MLHDHVDIEDDEGHFAEASSSGTSSSPEDNDAMFAHMPPPPSSIHYSSAARSHHSSTTKASKYKTHTATSSIPATHESRSSRSTHKLSSLLYITTERLDAESRRAAEAETRLMEMVERLKQVIQDRDKAVGDHIRVAEELRLHKAQLEFAQREVNRAQEAISILERQRDEAEEEAARQRQKARELREENIVMLAREQGRQMGFKEGLERGKVMGFEEGRRAGMHQTKSASSRSRHSPPHTHTEVDVEPEPEQQETILYRRRAPTPSDSATRRAGPSRSEVHGHRPTAAAPLTQREISTAPTATTTSTTAAHIPVAPSSDSSQERSIAVPPPPSTRRTQTPNSSSRSHIAAPPPPRAQTPAHAVVPSHTGTYSDVGATIPRAPSTRPRAATVSSRLTSLTSHSRPRTTSRARAGSEGDVFSDDGISTRRAPLAVPATRAPPQPALSSSWPSNHGESSVPAPPPPPHPHHQPQHRHPHHHHRAPSRSSETNVYSDVLIPLADGPPSNPLRVPSPHQLLRPIPPEPIDSVNSNSYAYSVAGDEVVGTVPRPPSALSRMSMRLSQFDLFSPPEKAAMSSSLQGEAASGSRDYKTLSSVLRDDRQHSHSGASTSTLAPKPTTRRRSATVGHDARYEPQSRHVSSNLISDQEGWTDVAPLLNYPPHDFGDSGSEPPVVEKYQTKSSSLQRNRFGLTKDRVRAQDVFYGHQKPPPPPPAFEIETPPRPGTSMSNSKLSFSFLRRKFNRSRSSSSAGVPGISISVEPPSNSPSERDSGRILDHQFLSPEPEPQPRLPPEQAVIPAPLSDRDTITTSSTSSPPARLEQGQSLPPGFQAMPNSSSESGGTTTNTDYFNYDARRDPNNLRPTQW